MPVPDVLRCENFDALWEEWGRHRREKGSKLTPTAARRQLHRLASWGVERAILAVNLSLANGWSGIFEPANGAAADRGTQRSADPTDLADLRAKVQRYEPDPEWPDA